MNHTKYQELRNENIQLFLGDNPKFKGILALGEEELKSTMMAAIESYQNKQKFTPYQNNQEFTRREMLQIIGFCAAELARIS